MDRYTLDSNTAGKKLPVAIHLGTNFQSGAGEVQIGKSNAGVIVGAVIGVCFYEYLWVVSATDNNLTFDFVSRIGGSNIVTGRNCVLHSKAQEEK